MLENNTDRSYFAIGAFLVGGVMISVLLAFFWTDLFGPAEYNAEAGKYEGGMIPAMMQNQFGTAPLDVEQTAVNPEGAVGLKVYDSAGREIKEDATLRPGETVTVKETMQMPNSGLLEDLSGISVLMQGSSGNVNNSYFEILESKMYDGTGSLITHESMQPYIKNTSTKSSSEINLYGAKLVSAVDAGLIKFQGEYFTQEVKLKVKDVDKYTQTPRLSNLWNAKLTVVAADMAADSIVLEVTHEQPLSVKVSPEDSIVPDTRLYLANGEEITDGIVYPGERVISETRFPTDTKEAAMAAGYSEKYNGEAIYLSGGAYWRPAEAADNASKERVSVDFVDYPMLIDSNGNTMDLVDGVAFSRGTQTLGHYLWKANFDTFDDFNFGDEYTAIYSFDVPDWPAKLGRDEVEINTAAMEFRYYTEHPVNGGRVWNRVFGQDYLGMTIKSGTRP